MRQPMARIALTGASGTGKTTLAAFIVNATGFPINPVGSRSVSVAMGFVSPYDVDKAGRRAEFQRRLIADKIAWEREHESFVTDRTPYDNIAYTALHDVSAIDNEMLDLAHVGYSRYTHVIYCPVDVYCNPDGDPSRVQDMTYHRIFDALLSGLLGHTRGDNLISLSTADIVERKSRVIKFVRTGQS